MIKEIRKKTGISQYKLAIYLGVSRGLINLAERGERDINGEAYEKLTFLYIQLLESEKQQKKLKATIKPSPSSVWIELQTKIHNDKIQEYKLKIALIEKKLQKVKQIYEKNHAQLSLLTNAESIKRKPTGKNNIDDIWFKLLSKQASAQKEIAGTDTQESLEIQKKMYEGYIDVHSKILKEISSK